MFTISPSGGLARQLTTSGKNFRPAWSPDGRRIAYINKTASGVSNLWVMNADGSRKQQVTRLTAGVSAPTWSPNGTWLAFTSGTLKKVRSTAPFGSPMDIHMFAANSGDTRATPWTAYGAPSWSSSGRIAFLSGDWPSSPSEYLLVYDSRTGSVDAEWMIGGACCGSGYMADPAFTPDGKRLAITEQRFDEWEFENPPPNHIMTSLTPYNCCVDSNNFPTVPHDEDPAYSPSGRYMALMNDAAGAPTIYITSTTGSGRRALTTGYHPDWQTVR